MNKSECFKGLTERVFINEERIKDGFITIEAHHFDYPISQGCLSYANELHDWASFNATIEVNGKVYSYCGSGTVGSDYETYGYGIDYELVTSSRIWS